MKRFLPLIAASVGLALLQVPAASAATLTANVSISSQTMTVIHRGTVVGRWPVSTARRGKVTPTGNWSAKWLSRHHKSSRYNNAPMPYSIFYNGNFAVHGTYQTNKLGRPASAGCVRLAPDHAAKLFSLTKAEGLANTRIIIRQ
ncbi:L,D-transpeptidase [Mesorhizobium sp. YM1C-6-2]|jgi:lipoprotein-anchoring transpeptidase ErfK/SrfK|uniref:L,D-transpeptidase n=1 Tax=Mesorhizobium sp. YM1C-6-2 TaxID=1827501 RepID=UPI000EF1CAA4|nr:L,D-transpeptidase [Mesorhizobium sp. YM1C-6-2]RLP23359.1 L,D-transpeptidase [Mesorhizobium sp. YM1C-6-2]